MSRRGRAAGRRAALAFCAAGVLAAGAAGCGQAVAGSAQADQEAVRKASEAAYQRGIDAFEAHFEKLGTERNEHAKVYYYVRFDGRSLDRELETHLLGTPSDILSQVQNGSSAAGYDEYHPAGTTQDLVHLGERYRSLAPTEWVSVPTAINESFFAPCQLNGVSSACGLSSAIAQTRLDLGGEQPREAARQPDGTLVVRSGITVRSFFEEKVMVFTQERLAKVTPEMMRAVIPVTLTFAADGSFRKFELTATVPGEVQLQVQIGYETLGEVAKKDFPALPDPSKVTTLTDDAAVDALYAELLKPVS